MLLELLWRFVKIIECVFNFSGYVLIPIQYIRHIILHFELFKALLLWIHYFKLLKVLLFILFIFFLQIIFSSHNFSYFDISYNFLCFSLFYLVKIVIIINLCKRNILGEDFLYIYIRSDCKLPKIKTPFRRQQILMILSKTYN